MKKFEDLIHESHSGGNGTQARMDFDNGYGVSVIFGERYYSNGIDTYEIAVLFNGSIAYDTDITDDVIGHISSDKVTEIMKQVQELKKEGE